MGHHSAPWGRRGSALLVCDGRTHLLSSSMERPTQWGWKTSLLIAGLVWFFCSIHCSRLKQIGRGWVEGTEECKTFSEQVLSEVGEKMNGAKGPKALCGTRLCSSRKENHERGPEGLGIWECCGSLLGWGVEFPS